MNKLSKLFVGAAALGSAYVGLIGIIDNLLVSRKWVMPEQMQQFVANADISELEKVNEEYKKTLLTRENDVLYMVNSRGQKLGAHLYKSATASNVYILCAHGYRSDGQSEFAGIAQYYLDKGYNVLLVDHTASGISEGDYIGFGHYECEDCLQWLDYLKKYYGDDIIIALHGVSMGAATVMMMSGDERLPENVKMIVSDCGYTSAMGEFDHKIKALHLDVLPGLVPVVNYINRKRAGYDFRDTDAYRSVIDAKVPMLFVHGGADEFVPTIMSEQNYNACGSAIKDLLIIDGADHAQSFVTDRESYCKKLDEFIEKVGI